ncbi:hypothetical protein Hanom_Chr05g00411651 [Helianthus anomalus]
MLLLVLLLMLLLLLLLLLLSVLLLLLLIMDDYEIQIQMDEAPPAHPRGSRRRRPTPVDPLHGNPYLESIDSTPASRHCQKLRRMHIGAHAAIDWDAIDAISERHRVCRFIPVDSLWHRLFELAHTPSYRELLVEFLSTFTFHPPRADQPPAQPGAPPLPPEVSFRLACVWRSMTLAQFAVRCGLYLQEEIDTHVYTQGLVVVDKPTLLECW